MLPGSIAKVATLIAALEAGVIQPATRMTCPRRLEVDGHRLDCSHPDLGRPLDAVEALAHSCNGYFADIAGRLRRDDLDRAFGQLGLPPTSPRATVAASALGLDGATIPAERLLAAFVGLTTSGGSRVPPDVRRVVVDGLRGAAAFGTADAFRAAGLTALAKTGTAPMPGGGFEGLLVAVTPADRPSLSIVVMAPGAAGRDAARLAVEALAKVSPVGVAPSRRVRVGLAGPDGYRVISLPLEDYVSRVVSAEAAPGSGVEALNALAIVVRTFALRNEARHARDGFDLCDLTHCQVLGTATSATDAAAGATEGQALYYGGRPADVYYTASCGGHTERPSGAWPGSIDPPYLPARPEPTCVGRDRWETDVTAGDLGRALATTGRRGEMVRDLRITGRTASGRVASLQVLGLAPSDITGGDLRAAVGRTLGWQVLKSTLFSVTRTASGYRFTGSGRGHGVGLCVTGAARMAVAGDSSRAILAHYFPGAQIVGAGPSPGTIHISVPVGEERERERISSIGAAALREYSAKLGVRPPATVRVVAHPTVDAYTRATGQPWWTAGATRASRIDLIPLASLRQRAILEPTLRHEFAHVMTAGRLEGQPIWVREAVAMDLAGDPRFSTESASGRTASTAGGPCPTDAEWRALRSADELQRAYRRAAACYAAQRAAGKRGTGRPSRAE